MLQVVLKIDKKKKLQILLVQYGPKMWTPLTIILPRHII